MQGGCPHQVVHIVSPLVPPNDAVVERTIVIRGIDATRPAGGIVSAGVVHNVAVLKNSIVINIYRPVAWIYCNGVMVDDAVIEIALS